MKMKFNLKNTLIASVAAMAIASGAVAGGLYTPGFPQAGSVPNTLPLTGNELIPADTQLGQGLVPQTESISVAQLIGAGYADAANNVNTSTSSTTLSAGQVDTGSFVVLRMTGTLGAAANATTPSAAQIIAQMPNVMQGGTYTFRFINNSSANFAWTLQAGANVTINGSGVAAQNTYIDFLVTLNQSAGTVSFQRIGSGAA